MMRQLGGVDSMLAGAETASTFLHVVGVMTLDVTGMRGADPRERIRSLVAERIPVLEPFRWRLVETPGGLSAPHWIHDPDFDLDRHIRLATLPKPGSTAELERYVGDVAGVPLSRDRPLWEMHLVDGLADGQVAVVAKLHHAFMDGGAGVEIMASLFDLDPETDTPAPDDDWEPEAIPSGWSLLAGASVAALHHAQQIPGVTRRAATGLGGLLGAMFPTGSGDPRSYLAPRTPYNGALSPRRVVALADYSLNDVKRVKAAFGTTVNDVVLAAVASSLRADLAALDGLETLGSGSVVVAVPVSVRPPDLERDFGNQTSMMMVPLPTHIEDPIERLHEIHVLALQIKDQHRAMGENLIEDLAGMLPPWAISAGSRIADRLGLSRLMPPLFNLIVSNLQGPPIPLYLAGAEVTAIYPLGPLMLGTGLNITVIGNRGRLHIGLIADPTLVEHPTELAAGLNVGFDELLALIPKPESTAARKRSRSGAKIRVVK